MAGSDVQDQDNTALASETLLRDLAGQLVEWKFLGRHLGLTEGNLDDIERNNKGDSKEIKYQTLLKWKRKSGQRSTIVCLAKALKKVDREDLAAFVMEDCPVETKLTLDDLKKPVSLTVEDCREIAIFLRLPACYVQEIERSQNSVACLIDKINDGRDNSDSTINALLFALQNNGKIRAANLILNSEGLPSSIKARASSKDCPVETKLTLDDLKKLVSFTVEDCREIAIFLRLPACYVQEIKRSQNSMACLIDKINDGRDNSDSTINALLFALQNNGKTRAANLILNLEGLPSSIKARASSKENILPSCVCGCNSYKELKSDSDESVVSLQCNICAAEWFPATESAKEASLIWNNKKFSYKNPRELDLSELKHEQVKDVNELKRGDHIVFRRAEIYDHHAIFLHKSEKEKGKITVIHWTSQAISVFKGLVGGNENVICDDQTFPAGGVKRVQYKRCDPADVVVARAYDMLYNSNQKYDLVKNNCESLATFCKVSNAFSIQGEVVGDLLADVPKFPKKSNEMMVHDH